MGTNWKEDANRSQEANLRQHPVDVTQQEDDGENASDADSEPIAAILWTHPEYDPTEHDKKEARKVQLNHVESQTPLKQEWNFDDGVIA